METVPFNPNWADSGSKLDLHAYYQGRPGDDRYVRLPVRRHNDWTKKGMRYVSLAHAEDVLQVAGQLRGVMNLDSLGKSYENNGTGAFKIFEYAQQQHEREANEATELRSRLAQLDAKAESKADGKAKKGASL